MKDTEPKKFDTNKGPDDFKLKECFICYCKLVASYIYSILIGDKNKNARS